ncbi:MAG: PilZ domain-containing protein [Bdellovibrionales bacterium]|nr:PilZ domain-containing protein [Bdellovibrionales bacterium]
MAKAWYVFSQGASFGPLETKVVKVMLQQKRVTLVEFIWCEGMAQWQRIRDVAEFGTEKLPPYPNVPIPSEAAEVSESEAEEESVEEVEAQAEEVLEEEAQVEEAEEVSDPEAEAVEEVEAEAEPEPEPEPAPKPKLVAKPKPVAGKKVAAKPIAKTKVAAASAAKPAAAAGQQPTLKELMLQKAKAKKAGAPTKAYVTIRRHERIETDAVIEVAGHGKFTLINMSVSGALLKSEKGIPAGTNLKLKLHCKELPKSPFAMTGVIVRDGTEQGKTELALEFTRVNPAHKRALEAYVKGKLSGAKKAA